MIRPGHIITPLITLCFFLFFLYGIDFFLKNSYNSEVNKYGHEFSIINKEILDGNLEGAIYLSNAILSKSETGYNEIKSRAYIGLCKAKQGKIKESHLQLESLMETYPGINMVFKDYYTKFDNQEGMIFIFNQILGEYIDSYTNFINEEFNVFEILNFRVLLTLISLMLTSILVYERIRIKINKKNA